MPTYQLASPATTDLMLATMAKYHTKLDVLEIKIGVLMVHADVDEKSGEKKGTAIKGHAGAPAMGCIKVVPLKDRVTKMFDAELHIDGDAWPKLSEKEKIAFFDHELTHLQPTGELDDIGRPKLKLREEDFIVWGFFEVAQRHGMAALEAQSVKKLIDEHGQVLLGLEDSKTYVLHQGGKK